MREYLGLSKIFSMIPLIGIVFIAGCVGQPQQTQTNTISSTMIQQCPSPSNNWQCSNWSSCSNGLQSRSCSIINQNCPTSTISTLQSCITSSSNQIPNSYYTQIASYTANPTDRALIQNYISTMSSWYGVNCIVSSYQKFSTSDGYYILFLQVSPTGCQAIGASNSAISPNTIIITNQYPSLQYSLPSNTINPNYDKFWIMYEHEVYLLKNPPIGMTHDQYDPIADQYGYNTIVINYFNQPTVTLIQDWVQL